MCSISGFINFRENYLKSNAPKFASIAQNMAELQRHRGPDSSDTWVGEHAVFSHARLAVVDIEGGKQPMKRSVQGYEFIITYNRIKYSLMKFYF